MSNEIDIEKTEKYFFSTFYKKGKTEIEISLGGNNDFPDLLKNVDISEFSKIKIDGITTDFYKDNLLYFKMFIDKINYVRSGGYTTRRRVFIDKPKYWLDVIKRLKRMRVNRLKETPTLKELEIYLNRNPIYGGYGYRINIKIERSLIEKCIHGEIKYKPVNNRGNLDIYFTNNSRLPAPNRFTKAIVRDKFIIFSNNKGGYKVRTIEKDDYEEFKYSAFKSSYSLTSSE